MDSQFPWVKEEEEIKTTVGLKRFILVDDRIKYITKEEYDEIHKDDFTGIKMSQADFRIYFRNRYQDREKVTIINPEKEDAKMSDASSTNDSLQQEQDLSLQNNDEIYAAVTATNKENLDTILKEVKVEEASAIEEATMSNGKSDSDSYYATVMQCQSALNKSSEESSDDEGPPQLSPPHLSEESAEGCVLYQPGSEMTESDESPSNEEEEELRDDNDTRQCRDDAPSAILHTQEPCTKQKESVRLMWCKLCDTYYHDIKDLKIHIAMCHDRDPSRINKWNNATWDLEIGKSLHPPSDNSDGENA